MSPKTIALTLSGLVILAIGGLFLFLGLDNADHISSGIGAAAGVIGLILVVAGPVRDARASNSGRLPSITMHAEATDNARNYQVGQGDMTVEDHR
jgi:hypothetical protein